MNSWAHLPNAVHIDRILLSFKLYPYQWNEASGIICDEAQDEARGEVFAATYEARRSTVYSTVWSAAWASAAWSTSWDVLRGALMCLVAYDDCAYMIDSDVGELKILAAFGDEKAILLLPACIVFNAIRELNVIHTVL